MEGARIITLVDNPVETGAVTFEEAFGEQSELRGRGRARRQARRMDRINKRRERKAAKQEARQERKNRRVEGRNNRRAMKGQSQREEEMANAENEKAVEALDPQEDDSTGMDQSQDNSGEEQAPEELDQNSEAEDSESEFEAGSTSEYTSSFDAETSDASGKKPRPLADRFRWHKKMIEVQNAKIAALKAEMQSGKMPSNKLAHSAKLIKKYQGIIQKSNERIAELRQRRAALEKGGAHGKPHAQKNPLTPVSRGLNAKLSTNKIEVPANSSADGDDFNSAEGDDFASFDAKEVIKKNKNVLIGVGVAVAVIAGLHFAGVFKK